MTNRHLLRSPYAAEARRGPLVKAAVLASDVAWKSTSVIVVMASYYILFAGIVALIVN